MFFICNNSHLANKSSWVFSDQLPKAEQTGHDVYTPTSNATKMDGYSWSIQYGDGSHASGDVYKDVVEIGGVTAPRQAVEAASDISEQFVQDRDNDGLLGLSFSSINTGESTSRSDIHVLINPSQTQASNYLL